MQNIKGLPMRGIARVLLGMSVYSCSVEIALAQEQAPAEPTTMQAAAPESSSNADLDALLTGANTDNAKPLAETTPQAVEPAVTNAAAPPTEAQPSTAQAAAAELPLIPVTDPSPKKAKPKTDKGAPQQIEEIVVTATKREESLREIPASIAALKGEDLERNGARGVEDIARLVPGVNFSDDSVNASKVTIRGISATTLGNPTTGVLFGDVSFNDAYLPRVTLDPNPFDMQTIEVLKGPQGTLFGSAALNGAVRYVPQPPKFGVFETRWFAQYTSISQGGAAPTYGAAVNLPWGDDLALRLMAFRRKSPGWIDNTATHEDDINRVGQEGARGILGWRPAEDFNVRLTYVWQQTNVNDTGFADGTDGKLTRASTSKPSPIDSQYRLGDLVLRYSFDDMDLVSDTAWVSKRAHKAIDASTDLTGSTTPYVLLDDKSYSTTYSQELRLISTDTGSPWRWVTGAVVSRQDLHFTPAYSTPLVPGLDLGSVLATVGLPNDGSIIANGDSVNLLRVATQSQIKDLALFGDITRRIGESVELSIGGRLYRSNSDGLVVQDGALVVVEGSPKVVNQAVIKNSGFNPKASALWHITDDLLLYTAASKGFRGGGLQPGFTTPLSAKQAPKRFQADTLWNYEVGTRTQWLDNTLHVDVTGFYIDWNHPQTLLTDSAVHLPYLDNVGRVKSTGVEAAVQWLPEWVPGLALNLSGAEIRTVTAEAFVGQTGANIPKGTPFPYAARWQTSTNLAYQREFGNWRAGAGVTHSYLSGAYVDLEKTLPIFDYQQWDAQLNLANTEIHWLPEMTFTVSNLTDERGVANSIVGGVAIRVEKSTYIQPRALMLRLSGNF